MHLKKICIFIFLIINSIAAQKDLFVPVLTEKDLKHFSVIEKSMHHTGTDACINKVSDGKNIYIVKQITDPSTPEQLLLVTDAICSTIGTACAIQVNHVSFIPYNVGAHLKIYPDRAATLHTYVSGTDLESSMPKALADKDFTLHQRIIKKDCPWQKKYPVASNRQGLTQDIIESMSFHKALPSLVALDTFIGNADRSLPNILYDEQKNSFFGIDHAAGLHTVLAFESCERIQELIRDDYFKICSTEIKNSLQLYKNSLVQLAHAFNPPIVRKMLDHLATYVCYDALHNEDIVKDIAHFNNIFERNFAKINELIALLNTVKEHY